MGEAKRKRDYRNRPEDLAKSFYQGKLSQRDAERMRVDREEGQLRYAKAQQEITDALTRPPTDEERKGLWALLFVLTVTGLTWWGLWEVVFK